MESKKNIPIRVKQQRVPLEDSKISKNDCEEFIRIVKKFSNSLRKEDLLNYTKKNGILLNEETISCMFEEIYLDNKKDEITAVDLYALVTKKKKRCFYFPVVFFIGKSKYLDSYEKKLKKEQKLIEEEAKRKLENMNRYQEKIKRQSCDIQEEIENESTIIESFNDSTNELGTEENMNITKEANIVTESTTLTENEMNIQRNSISTPQMKPESKEKVQEEEHGNVDISSIQKNKKNTKKKNSVLVEKGKDHGKKTDKNKNNTKHTLQNKKDQKNTKNGIDKDFSKVEKNEEDIENKELFEDKKTEEKKQKYNVLLQKVLYNVQTRKKQTYLESFHFTAYYKLHELIYISYLIEKYYDFYHRKERMELVLLYEESIKEKEMELKESVTTTTGNIEINESKRENVILKKEQTKPEPLSLLHIIKRYDEERKQKKENIFRNKTDQYIHSDLLTNQDFITDHMGEIIQNILYNLNIFFNRNINDIRNVIKEYDFIIQKVCESEETPEDNSVGICEKMKLNEKMEEGLNNPTIHMIKVLKKRNSPKRVPTIKGRKSFSEDISLSDEFIHEERKCNSDDCISYEYSKYTIDEVNQLKDRNLIYELSKDINKMPIYNKTYFYDFFFIYLLRKLFWNIFALYNLYLKKYISEENRNNKYEKNFFDYQHIYLYESDVSVNNVKKNKELLYNTNEILLKDLTDLFDLIKRKRLLMYLRMDKNKKIKQKYKTEYIFRDIWIYLILTVLNKKKGITLNSNTMNQFIFFQEQSFTM